MVVVEQLRWTQAVGDQGRMFGQIFGQSHPRSTHEVQNQTSGQIIEVMDPFTEIRIRHLGHTGADVILHSLDRGFGRQTSFNGVFDPGQPTGVLGDQPIGFKHIAMLATLSKRIIGQ